METIGAILAQAGSSRRAGSEATSDKREQPTYTSKDVFEGRIRSNREVPEPEICEFCGRKLYHKAIVHGEVAIIYAPFAERCTCEKATEKWRAYDDEQARLKAEAEEQERRKRKTARIEKLLGKSGIMKRFQQRTFENFIQDTPERKYCYKVAKAYADRFPYHAAKGEGLYIEGTNGTGKTHLAAAIALQLINEGLPVICKTSSDMLADIKRGFDSGEVTEYEVLKAYKEVDLLIIDDLGKEQCTEWSISTLYSILNFRYEDMRPTIVTTNYNTDGLLKALTPKGADNSTIKAIISRLRETSAVLTMAWKDCRGGQR